MATGNKDIKSGATRRWSRAALFVFVVALLALAPFAARRLLLTPKVADRIGRELSRRVEAAFNEPLQTGRTRVDLFGRIIIEDVQLGEDPNPIFRADSIRVALSLSRLVAKSSNPANLISSVTVVRPVVHVIRHEDGDWNYFPLARGASGSSGGGLPEFDVILRDARVIYDDNHAEAPYPITHAELEKANARISLLRERVLLLDLKAEEASFGRRLELQLRYDRRAGWKIEGSLDDVGLATAMELFGLSEDTIEGTLPSIDFFIESAFTKIGHSPNFSWSGRTRLENARINPPGIDFSLENVNTDVVFTRDRTSFKNGAALLGGSPVSFDGSFFDYGSGGAAFNVKFTDIAIADLLPATGSLEVPEGRVSGTAVVLGSGGKLRATISSAARDVVYGRVRVDRLDSMAIYDGDFINVVSAKAALGGGIVEGTGDFSIRDGALNTYRFSASFDDLDVNEILRFASASTPGPLGGRISGEAFVSGNGSDDGSLAFFGTAVARDLTGEGLDGCEAIAGVSYSDGLLTIENFTLHGDEKAIIASGTISEDGRIDVAVEAARAPVATLLALAGRADLEGDGIVTLDGQASGTLAEPGFSGSFQIESFAVSSFAADRAEGGFSFDAGVLELDDISIFVGGERHELFGKVDFNDESMALYLNVNDSSLKNIAELARDALHLEVEWPEDMDGTINARSLVAGTFKKPAGTMSLTISNATILEQTLTKITAAVEFDGMDISGTATMEIEESVINASGAVKDGELDLSISAKGFRLEGINELKRNQVAGALDFQAEIKGAVESPEIEIKVGSEGLSISGVDFVVAETTVTYAEEFLSAKEIRATRGDEKYTLGIVYDRAASGLDVSVDLEDAALKTLAGLLPFDVPEGTEGELAGRVRVYAIGDELSGGVKLEGKDLSLGTYPISELILEGSFQGRKLDVRKFQASNDISTVTVSGVIDLDRKAAMHVNVDARGIELARISEMGLIAAPIGGFADVVLDFVTEGDKQITIGSFDAYDPRIANVVFERGRGRFEYDGRIFTLINAQFLHEGGKLVVSGDIPIDAQDETSLKITPETENFNASILNPALAPYGIEIKGVVDLDGVEISGSLDKPEFAGEARLSGGEIRHDGFDAPITDVAGKIVFNGAGLTLDALRGVISGQEVRVRGEMGFLGMGVDSFKFELEDVADLYVRYENVYAGKVDLENIGVRHFDGKTELYGCADAPPAVVLHDGTFTLPQMEAAAQKPSSEAKSRSMGFGERGLTTRVGEGFSVRTASNDMMLIPHGLLQMSGTIAEPLITGWLTSSRGYVRAFANTFKMVDNTYIGFFALPDLGPVPIFYAKARTRAGGTEIYMEISGPMLDLDLLPAYRNLCGESVDFISGAGLNAPSIALGESGEMIVPVCPEVSFEAWEANDPAAERLTNQQVMQKLTHTDAFIEGGEVGDSLRTEAFDIFSPYVGNIIESKADLENFAFNLDPNKDLLVQLEKRVAGRFYLKYDRLFSREVREELEVRYKFRSRSFLKWKIDQDSKTDYQVEYRIRY